MRGDGRLRVVSFVILLFLPSDLSNLIVSFLLPLIGTKLKMCLVSTKLPHLDLGMPVDRGTCVPLARTISSTRRQILLRPLREASVRPIPSSASR
jgi:hypothetical protein